MMLTLLLNQLRHETRPTRLMTRANARAIIAVEVLVERDVIAPVWVILERFVSAKNGAASVRIAQEDIDHAM